MPGCDGSFGDDKAMQAIDFYFDFLSPYAYLASHFVERIAEAHGRKVVWRPFRLGVAVVKVMGLRPVMETPLKNDYVRRDLVRMAAVLDLPLTVDRTLVDPLPPALLFYATPEECRPLLAKALLTAQWGEGRDISEPSQLTEVAARYGVSHQQVEQALAGEAQKLLLKVATQEAIARGVFGSPTCAIDDELFWGADRLWLLEHHLQGGGAYPKLTPGQRSVLALGAHGQPL